MKVETKYDIGQEVFIHLLYMQSGVVAPFKIQSVSFMNQSAIPFYHGTSQSQSYGDSILITCNRPESEVFGTREEAEERLKEILRKRDRNA